MDLNTVLTKVKQNLKVSIDDNGAVITADPLPVLKVHEGYLIPLFQNLIANAIKYRSEQAPRIHVSALETDGKLRFAVADNGIGIDPEYHRKFSLPSNGCMASRSPGPGSVWRFASALWSAMGAASGWNPNLGADPRSCLPCPALHFGKRGGCMIAEPKRPEAPRPCRRRQSRGC